MTLPASPTTPSEVLSIAKNLKNNKSIIITGHDHIKKSKTYHKKPSFFSPTSLMLYFDYLISLPLGN
jgi:hypothetical protein